MTIEAAKFLETDDALFINNRYLRRAAGPVAPHCHRNTISWNGAVDADGVAYTFAAQETFQFGWVLIVKPLKHGMDADKLYQPLFNVT